MSEIRLQDGRINFEGDWLSTEDLTKKINEKMQSGDLKIAKLAALLEELNTALAQVHTLDIKLVLTKDEHEKLKTVNEEDYLEFLRKATRAFLDGKPAEHALLSSPSRPDVKTKTIVVCRKCKTPIEIERNQRPAEIECPKCGSSWRIKEAPLGHNQQSRP